MLAKLPSLAVTASLPTVTKRRLFKCGYRYISDSFISKIYSEPPL